MDLIMGNQLLEDDIKIIKYIFTNIYNDINKFNINMITADIAFYNHIKLNNNLVLYNETSKILKFLHSNYSCMLSLIYNHSDKIVNFTIKIGGNIISNYSLQPKQYTLPLYNKAIAPICILYMNNLELIFEEDNMQNNITLIATELHYKDVSLLKTFTKYHFIYIKNDIGNYDKIKYGMYQKNNTLLSIIEPISIHDIDIESIFENSCMKKIIIKI
jgi:hypothetical protein